VTSNNSFLIWFVNKNFFRHTSIFNLGWKEAECRYLALLNKKAKPKKL